MYYEDMGGRERKRPLSFMLKLNSEESIIEGAAPSVGVGGGVQYDFGKSYEVGTEFSYKRPYSQFENYRIQRRRRPRVLLQRSRTFCFAQQRFRFEL